MCPASPLHYSQPHHLLEVGMIALSLAGIALISLLAQWLAWSLRVPAILFLLLLYRCAAGFRPDDC